MMRDGKALSVIHVATSHTGGAGIAARRLNSELNSMGVNSSFYALAKKSYSPLDNEFALERTWIQRIAGGLSRILSDRLINQSFFSITSAPGVSTKWLITKVRDENAVLHIHNWFNLLTKRQIKKLIFSKIPIMITLHDQRFMTGGCHTAVQCKKFRKGCIACPRVPKQFRFKVRRNNSYFAHLFKDLAPNVRIIAPSKFIQSEARQSISLKMQDIVFAPNVLSSNYVQAIQVSNRNFRAGEITLGVASLNNKDWLKGSDIVELLLNHYKDDSKVSFRFFADVGPGREELFWDSIDCLLVPSRGDNSPNVIHEAKIRGIPVIASEVGGIPELLTENFDFMVDGQDLNLGGFVHAIEVMRIREKAINQPEIMLENFQNYTSGSLDTIVSTYKELFK